jgi:hypothetical protein
MSAFRISCSHLWFSLRQEFAGPENEIRMNLKSHGHCFGMSVLEKSAPEGMLARRLDEALRRHIDTGGRGYLRGGTEHRSGNRRALFPCPTNLINEIGPTLGHFERLAGGYNGKRMHLKRAGDGLDIGEMEETKAVGPGSHLVDELPHLGGTKRWLHIPPLLELPKNKSRTDNYLTPSS